MVSNEIGGKPEISKAGVSMRRAFTLPRNLFRSKKPNINVVPAAISDQLENVKTLVPKHENAEVNSKKNITNKNEIKLKTSSFVRKCLTRFSKVCC